VGAINWNTVANYVVIAAVPDPARTGAEQPADHRGLYHHDERHLGLGQLARRLQSRGLHRQRLYRIDHQLGDTHGSVTGLTFNSGDLVANTTYYLRVGSLWNGTTDYANTTPASTSTLTSLLTASSLQVYRATP